MFLDAKNSIRGANGRVVIRLGSNYIYVALSSNIFVCANLVIGKSRAAANQREEWQMLIEGLGQLSVVCESYASTIPHDSMRSLTDVENLAAEIAHAIGDSNFPTALEATQSAIGRVVERRSFPRYEPQSEKHEGLKKNRANS